MGISYAFESGYILSKIFNENKDITCAEYNMAAAKIKLKLMLKLLKNPFMYNPFLRKLVMKSGVQAINMIEKDSI